MFDLKLGKLAAIGASALALASGAQGALATGALAGTFPVSLGLTTAGCVAQSWFAWGMNGAAYCSIPPYTGGGWDIEPSGLSVVAGAAGQWQINAPAGISIANATSYYAAIAKSSGYGWRIGGYWSGGSNSWSGTASQAFDAFASPSSYYGFKLYCYASSCDGSGLLAVGHVDLTAVENRGPGLFAIGSNNLWYQGGNWIRNDANSPAWPLTLAASDASGVCSMYATIQGQTIGSPPQTPTTSQWQECPNWTWTAAQGATVDTRSYVPRSGQLSLQLGAYNAAGVKSATSVEKLQVDNDPVSLSLSGPTTASTTAGTQYVTATATAGPSGVSIGCSMDGSPVQWQNGAANEVPVAGVGNHTVSCQAHNGAIDPQGQYAYSAAQNWTLDIGQPTVSVIGFAKIVNALKCGAARTKVTIPARWVSVRRHRRLVKVRKPARTKIVTVQQCHPRIVWRREKVWVKVRRHGKLVLVRRTERVRVPLLPHAVMRTKKRVAYGRGTAVNGWLGTAGGVGIGGVPVEILTAPNDGQGQFTRAATATTAANGSWTAQLSPGPSRLVEASYGGSPTLLGTTSTAVQTITPAKVRIKITPRIVPWGSMIRITGRVLGGYVPNKSNLLRLNVGVGRIGQLEGLPQIRPDGRFVIFWKFDAGQGVIHPWFSVGTLSESSFAYAPGTSNRVVITLGKRTPQQRRQSRHHRTHKRRKRVTGP